MAPKARRGRKKKQPETQTLPQTHAELETMMEDRIAAALAQYEANRTHTSGGPPEPPVGGSGMGDRATPGI